MPNLPKPGDTWVHLGLSPMGFPLPGLQRTHSSWRRKENISSALPILLASCLFSVPLLLWNLWEKKNQFCSLGQPVKFAHRSPNQSQMNAATFLPGYNSIKPPNGLYITTSSQRPPSSHLSWSCLNLLVGPWSCLLVSWIVYEGELGWRGSGRAQKTKPWVFATSGYSS